MFPSVVILAPLGIVVITGLVFVLLARRFSRDLEKLAPRRPHRSWRPDAPLFHDPPKCWLAIRCHNPLEVQSALRLHNALPCSWREGLEKLAEDKLFISPPVNGWILVLGGNLPEPSEDVDDFYRFLLKLSRKLGLVIYFGTHPVLAHHAWVKTLNGQVVRAYCWAGETLWTQGDLTQAELDLGFHCEPYGTKSEGSSKFREQYRANTEKVFSLAARWSVDPRLIDRKVFGGKLGVAGELSHPKLH